MKHSKLLIYLCALLILGSCLEDAPDDFDNPNTLWSPSFSIALGTASLGMNIESGFDTTLLGYTLGLPYPDWTYQLNDIVLEYTLPFDMEEIGQFSEEVVKIKFRINTYNGFPSEASAQAYFLDIDDRVVQTLFSGGPLKLQAGNVVDDQGTVKKNHYQTDVIISQENIDTLQTVRNIFIQGRIKNLTLDTTLIEYYPNYSFDVQMGLQVELALNIGVDQNENIK